MRDDYDTDERNEKEVKSVFDRPGKPARLSTPKSGPVWKGPEKDGVTFSLLCKFFQCPERFRVYAVEGLKPKETFNHKSLYGDFWHRCEEVSAEGGDWQEELYAAAEKACERYPMDQDEVERWYRVCSVQFPVYLGYWRDWEIKNGLFNVTREEVFNIPYRLPSGRVVRLRGKRDGRYRQGRETHALFETKTKGDVDETQLQQQLTFDLQTMMYVTATRFEDTVKDEKGTLKQELYDVPPVNAVYYNVVRRPLSGGKGTIVRHKATDGAKCPKCKGHGKASSEELHLPCPKCGGKGRVNAKPAETWESYCDRLRGVIDGTAEDAPGPNHFFHRWVVPITDGDVKVFRETCLDPVLERLCNWWAVVTNQPVTQKLQDFAFAGYHFRMPYGVHLPLLDGGSTGYDEYLRTGSRLGLEPVDNYFRELT